MGDSICKDQSEGNGVAVGKTQIKGELRRHKKGWVLTPQKLN